MPLPFNGTVLSINQRPAAGVEVRVFDIDNPEASSDELTLSTAVSGPDGHFSLLYEPALGVDFVDQTSEVVWFEPADPLRGDLRPVRRTRKVTVRVPDLSDQFDPALDFRYSAAGQAASVRRRGFHSPATLPHLVSPEPVTWPQYLGLANGADGRPVAFVRGADGRIWVIRQLTSGGICSAQQMPDRSDVIGPFRIGRNLDGRLEVFGRHQDGRLMHSWEIAAGGSWSAWQSLGGQLPAAGALAVASNSDGRIEVFARGTDGALWHIWQNADRRSWSNWASLGGQIPNLGTVVTALDQDGRLTVFYHGMDHQIWMLGQAQASQGPWSAHRSLGSRSIAGPLAAARNQDGRLEVFAQGRDGDILHAWQVGAANWSRWESLGGIWVAGSLAVSHHADGRLVVIAQATDRRLHARSQHVPNGGWDGWIDLDQPTGQGWLPPVPHADPVTIDLSGEGTLLVVWRGATGTVHVRQQSGPNGLLAGWTELGSVPPPPELSAPSLQSAVAGNRSVRLEWTGVSGAERYVANWARVGGAGAGSMETTGTVLFVTELDNDVEYEFSVVARNRCHQSQPSNRLTATPAARPDLAAGFVHVEALPRANTDFAVRASVANIGTLATAASFRNRMICQMQPADAPLGAPPTFETHDFGAILPPFAPGEVRNLEWVHSRPKGDYYYWLVVDFENTVSTELDEGNNTSGAVGVTVVD